MTPGYAPSAKKRHRKRKIAAPVGPLVGTQADSTIRRAGDHRTGGNPARGDRLAVFRSIESNYLPGWEEGAGCPGCPGGTRG
jgi:hypothetical protein